MPLKNKEDGTAEVMAIKAILLMNTAMNFWLTYLMKLWTNWENWQKKLLWEKYADHE